MKKSAWILICLTAGFALLLTGIFAGRNSMANGGNLSIENPYIQIQTSEEETAVPGKIDLNTATSSQLVLLPGIGEATAQLIIAYRQELGAFEKIEDLLNIRGIGEKKLERIRDYITVGGQS